MIRPRIPLVLARLAVLSLLVPVACSLAWSQEAESDSEFPAALSDPAFDKYVDLSLLASAWEEKDAELLTDLGLQLAEGERVLQRSHKAITADQLFSAAVKIAAEHRDQATLARLAKVLATLKKTDLLTKVTLAQQLASQSRAPDPGLNVQVDRQSPAGVFILQGLLEDITEAKLAGDAEALDAIIADVPQMTQLTESQRQSVLKLASQARAALPKDSESGDPATSALNKLLAESRAARPRPAPKRPAPKSPGKRPPVAKAPGTRPPVAKSAGYKPPVAKSPGKKPPVAKVPVAKVPVAKVPVAKGGGSGKSGTGGKGSKGVRPPPPPPVLVQKNYVSRTFRSRITYVNSVRGIRITNGARVTLVGDLALDPGDEIISVGNVSACGTRLTLEELFARAYQSGNLVIVIRDADTGELETFDLPADDGGDDADNPPK